MYTMTNKLCSNFLGILKSQICSASWNNTAKVKYTYKDEQHFSTDIVKPYINLIHYLSCTCRLVPKYCRFAINTCGAIEHALPQMTIILNLIS